MEDDVQSQGLGLEENEPTEVQEETEDIESPDLDQVEDDVEESKPKGDLTVALRKEREERKKLQEELTRLKTPGLSGAPVTEDAISATVQRVIQLEKAKEELPILKTSKHAQLMFSSLVLDDGLTPSQAVKQFRKIASSLSQDISTPPDLKPREGQTAEPTKQSSPASGRLEEVSSLIRTTGDPAKREALIIERMKLKRELARK